MRKLIRHIHTLIFFSNYLLVIFGYTYAQNNNIKFNRLNIQNGLSQSVVTDVIQDSKGFIWVATQDGLNRYDGYKFKVFKNDPKDSTSLPHNYINYLFEDSKQNLWICTNGAGLALYDKNKESFLSFAHNPSDSTSLSSNFVKCIEEDKKGNLWIGTNGKGLNKLVTKKSGLTSRQNISFQRFSHNLSKKKSLSDNGIYRIGKDYLGNLWIGTLNGLNLLVENEEGISFKKFFKEPKTPNSLSDNFIRCFMSDRNDNLWIGTDSGSVQIIYKDDLVNAEKKDIVFNDIKKHSGARNFHGISINDIYQDNNGIIWIGIWGGGIVKHYPESGKTAYFTHEKADPQSISNNDLIALFQDKSGMMWAGTYGGGLNVFDPDPKKFAHFKNEPWDNNSISDNLVVAISQDYKSNLWVGTWNGLNKFSPDKQTVTRYFNDPKDKYSISNNRITAITESKILPGVMWIGTLDGGLNLYVPSTNSFIEISTESLSDLRISNDRILSILEDSKGILWVGTLSGGLNKLKNPLPKTANFIDIKSHLDSSRFINYKHHENDSNSLPSDRIEVIYEDSEQIVWIGTYYGLCMYDNGTDSFKNFDIIVNEKHKAEKERFSSICESANKDLWFGTWGQGIKHLEYADKADDNFIFNTIKEIDGLPNNYIHSILCDSDSSIWIATNMGLSKYDCENGSFRNYDAADGLQSNEFKHGAFVNKATGEMFFGGINGFNSFFPDSIKANKYLPPVAITDFKLFNKPVKINEESVLNKSITEQDEITLSYEQYIFSLYFSAFNFDSPGKNRYAYMLEGFDIDWNYTDSKSRTAVYTNLDGGEYIFRVKASNNDGYWNEEGTALKVKILPPFWETTWFYLLVIFSLLLIGFAIYKWRLKSIKTQKKLLEIEVEERTKELKELNAAKNKFFSIVSHDLKGPFNVFMNTSQFLASDVNELSKIEIRELAESLLGSSRNLYKLLDNLLQWSKIQMGGITVSNTKINVKKIIDNNIKLFSGFAAGKGIKLKDKTVNDSHIYSDENMLNTVLRNLISNAIKFTGEGGEIIINTLKNGSTVRFCVSDSGVGIPQEFAKNLFKIEYKYSTKGTDNESGSGLGLIICKEFVELTKGNIWIESEKDKGTKVFFTQKIYNSG